MIFSLTPRPRALIIEDERRIGEQVVRALTQENVQPAKFEPKDCDGIFVSKNRDVQPNYPQFDAELVENGETISNYLEKDNIDIFFVDLILKNFGSVSDGFGLISRIRHASATVGIIVLSGQDAIIRTPQALDLGADDYIEKPSSLEIIRRKASDLWKKIERFRPKANTFHIGEWKFVRGSRTLSSEMGRTVRLAPLEYAFLSQLIAGENHEVDRATFARLVLGSEFVDDDRRIDSLKKRLSKKLGETVQIVQIRDHGYKLLSAA